ncbi:MAG: 4-alpha-glucanotransferase [Chloroflexi bacterium]|nr:4-alpha-glucanotransferase [Chloroflexota bacterium]
MAARLEIPVKQTGEIPLFPRASGILVHITSLPGPHGIGSLGVEAREFVDSLACAGQHLWQILPLVPTGPGNSPYTALSAFAGNHLLISLTSLADLGLLEPADLAPAPSFPLEMVDYAAVHEFKLSLLRRAFEVFDRAQRNGLKSECQSFSQHNARWLDDYALFVALKHAHKGAPWWDWDTGLVSRRASALAQARTALAKEIRFHEFLQFTFFSQWFSLKSYANARQVRVVGDIPIFVAHDSADVWAHQDLFHLNRRGKPTVVAGVPPDYFAVTGQRWGNPIYRWDVLASSGFDWWVDRLREALTQVDIVRIDHFRGFEAYWEIPAEYHTAERGRWVKGPGGALFRAAEAALGQRLPIVVEDLGFITPQVEELRARLGYPGIKVLQFAFGEGADNPHRPENYSRNCVVYTATHDNDTTAGWLANLSESTRATVRAYIEDRIGKTSVDTVRDMIQLAFSSVADTAILPLQDVLGLGSEARMNRPGRSQGNWSWRCLPAQLTRAHLDYLADLTETCGRTPDSPIPSVFGRGLG